jgi:hypothetical protein
MNHFRLVMVGPQGEIAAASRDRFNFVDATITSRFLRLSGYPARLMLNNPALEKLACWPPTSFTTDVPECVPVVSAIDMQGTCVKVLEAQGVALVRPAASPEKSAHKSRAASVAAQQEGSSWLRRTWAMLTRIFRPAAIAIVAALILLPSAPAEACHRRCGRGRVARGAWAVATAPVRWVWTGAHADISGAAGCGPGGCQVAAP